MKSSHILLFTVSLLLIQDTSAAESGADEWIKINKQDLCPALHRQAICTGKGIDFDEVAKTIGKLGEQKKHSLSTGQVNTGQKASGCGEPLKKAFCSEEAKPLCLEDKKAAENPAARRVCRQLYNTCPLLAEKRSLEKYIDECEKYLKREYSDVMCKYVGADFNNGSCPRPKRKVPAFYIQIYKMQSEAMSPMAKLLDSANDVISKAWDPGCLKTVRELPCMPMYCSATNDNVVELKNKRKDCNRAMECVSKAADKLKSLIGNMPGGDNLAENIRKEVQKSCETVIKSFEVWIKATSKAKSGGAQSQASFLTYFTFLVVSLGLVIIF